MTVGGTQRARARFLVEEQGAQSLVIAFVAKPGDPAVTIQLKSDDAGFWSGDLKDGGADIQVRLRRG